MKQFTCTMRLADRAITRVVTFTATFGGLAILTDMTHEAEQRHLREFSDGASRTEGKFHIGRFKGWSYDIVEAV